MNINEIGKAFRRGLNSLRQSAGFFGSRLRVELALYSEMKEYERLKAELRDLYCQLGERFYKEASPEAKAPFMDTIERIETLQEEIAKKETEIEDLSKPEIE